jgi:hypothetical protein
MASRVLRADTPRCRHRTCVNDSIPQAFNFVNLRPLWGTDNNETSSRWQAHDGGMERRDESAGFDAEMRIRV